MGHDINPSNNLNGVLGLNEISMRACSGNMAQQKHTGCVMDRNKEMDKVNPNASGKY